MIEHDSVTPSEDKTNIATLTEQIANTLNPSEALNALVAGLEAEHASREEVRKSIVSKYTSNCKALASKSLANTAAYVTSLNSHSVDSVVSLVARPEVQALVAATVKNPIAAEIVSTVTNELSEKDIKDTLNEQTKLEDDGSKESILDTIKNGACNLALSLFNQESPIEITPSDYDSRNQTRDGGIVIKENEKKSIKAALIDSVAGGLLAEMTPSILGAVSSSNDFITKKTGLDLADIGTNSFNTLMAFDPKHSVDSIISNTTSGCVNMISSKLGFSPIASAKLGLVGDITGMLATKIVNKKLTPFYSKVEDTKKAALSTSINLQTATAAALAGDISTVKECLTNIKEVSQKTLQKIVGDTTHRISSSEINRSRCNDLCNKHNVNQKQIFQQIRGCTSGCPKSKANQVIANKIIYITNTDNSFVNGTYKLIAGSGYTRMYKNMAHQNIRIRYPNTVASDTIFWEIIDSSSNTILYTCKHQSVDPWISWGDIEDTNYPIITTSPAKELLSSVTDTTTMDKVAELTRPYAESIIGTSAVKQMKVINKFGKDKPIVKYNYTLYQAHTSCSICGPKNNALASAIRTAKLSQY